MEYGNVVFAAVVYLPEEIVGDALEGFEGKPYSNANLPEEGVIGIGYAMGWRKLPSLLLSNLCGTAVIWSLCWYVLKLPLPMGILF